MKQAASKACIGDNGKENREKNKKKARESERARERKEEEIHLFSLLAYILYTKWFFNDDEEALIKWELRS